MYKFQSHFISLILFLLISTTLAAKLYNSSIIIKGKIKGKISGKVAYTLPGNDYIFGGFKESVWPSSLGTFRIKLKLKETGFIKLYIANKHCTLIVEPGGVYEVKCDLNLKKDNFSFEGRHANIQTQYNLLSNPIHIDLGTWKFSTDSTALQVDRHVKLLKKEELSVFRELLSKGKVTQKIFDLIKNDRDCYYKTMQGTLSLYKFYQQIEKNNNAFTKAYKNLWSDAFSDFHKDKTNYKQSLWFYNYLDNYLKFKEYTSQGFSSEKLIELYKKGLIHTHFIETANQYLSGKELEFYSAAYIYIAALQKNYEKELEILFKQFKKDFPKNKHNKYIEPHIHAIKQYYYNDDEKANTDIRIINNYKQINSLDECLKLFKGSKVYVDVWATWCDPCKTEFEQHDKAISLLKSKNVKILYISIDKETEYLRWKNMIKNFNLAGYHIRTNKKLREDLRHIYNQKGILSIPWHLIIDENGRIINKNAPSPLEFNKLEKAFIN